MSIHTQPSLGTATGPSVDTLDRAKRTRAASTGTIAGSPRACSTRSPPQPCASSSGIAALRTQSPQTPLGDLVVHDRRTLAGPGRQSGSLVRRGLHGGPPRRARAARTGGRGLVSTVADAVLARPAWPGWLAIPNSLRAARDNVHHHYDLGNSFYQQWLDQELVYTCAYFERPEMSLDEAQHAKLDLVCRKLQLRPGDTVVEAGCGWGALALFMARHYGVHVKAFNVSTRATGVRARSRGARRADRPRRVHRRRLPQRPRAHSTCSSPSACWSTSAWRTSHTLRRRARSHAAPRWRPRAAALHRPGHAVSAEPVDSAADLPGRVHAHAGRGDDARPRASGHVGHRRREPAPALRSGRSSCGRPLRGGDETRCGRRYGDQFARAWELYLAGSQAAFATRVDAAVPDPLHAARVGAAVLVALGDLRSITDRAHDSL